MRTWWRVSTVRGKTLEDVLASSAERAAADYVEGSHPRLGTVYRVVAEPIDDDGKSTGPARTFLVSGAARVVWSAREDRS